LLPKVGPLGSCDGSNVAEMVYMDVVDGVTPKGFVTVNTPATLSHEFQHLINQARRLYINTAAAPTEERWLNEGLSHMAEELTFYRASGLAPRQNLGTTVFADPKTAQAFNFFQNQNFQRLKSYLGNTEGQAAIGTSDTDDDLATRGATWSFLRYAADQRFTPPEAPFWYRLVNSNVTGMQNLSDVVGSDVRLVMRDWTLSILLDDLVPGIASKYQSLSWNLRQAVSPYAPATRNLTNNASTGAITLNAGGTSFRRFGIAAGGEAYVSASGFSGGPLPKGILLALVRTK
jgi:hypothetical protein